MIDIMESNTDGQLGRSTLTPTTKKRRINLCVDALSAKMFRSLELNLTKKLTEMGASEYVEALLEALKSFTCQHDYLHEHRMHRQDVIWRQFYGCVLQAFQAETRTLRINGDPVKNNLQSHEAFLEICHKALKRHRMDRFLEKHGEHCFAELDGESVQSMILRWDDTFSEYCQQWDESEDQPTRLCNNLIKMLDAKTIGCAKWKTFCGMAHTKLVVRPIMQWRACIGLTQCMDLICRTLNLKIYVQINSLS